PSGGGSSGPAAGTARPEELPLTGGRHVLEPPPAAGGLGEARYRPDDEHGTAGPTRSGDEHRSGDEDGYVPPEPPPIGRGDFITTFAWVCVLGGPSFLLVAAVVWRDLPGWLLLAALAAFVGGFVLLVARLPGEPPDDPDDGAVV
ncbi:MAG TPA: hypothetical protein VFP72_20945, partial [Kineosporiaceae bacterium]|nr:hypothetical protein [Kineosporiaceae bacterium]